MAAAKTTAPTVTLKHLAAALATVTMRTWEEDISSTIITHSDGSQRNGRLLAGPSRERRGSGAAAVGA